MQASMDAFALKPFTKALTCLSKYGDDLTICATPDHISLAATNSSLSAYCRVKYGRQFFSRYHVGDRYSTRVAMADEVEELLTVTGQLLTKSLLSILKSRTVEKTVDRCELSIVEGVLPSQGADQDEGDEDRDSLESVVKTHRLLLLTPTSLLAPSIPDGSNESRLTIGPKPVRDMIEHFPFAKGGKSDPQLVWSFGDTEVQLKSCETSIDSKGKSQLSTELTISAEEFDVYDVYSPPITIAFHLREFNATIAFAESMALPLDLRFTDPSSPLFIDIEGDNSETLLVISTSQAGANPQVQSNAGQNPANAIRKRIREDDNENGNDDDNHNNEESINTRESVSRPRPREKERIKKPMKVVQRADPASVVHAQAHASSRPGTVRGSMPPPNSIPFRPLSQTPMFSQIGNNNSNSQDPLFLPGSQLSVADEEAIRDSGLGIESMGADELEALLEGDGEEVAFDFGSQRKMSQMNSGEFNGNAIMDRDDAMDGEEGRGAGDSSDVIEDMEMEATQADSAKLFKPLFED